jgi:hypothetical protein
MSSSVPFLPPPKASEAYQQVSHLASLASLDQAVGTTTHLVGDLNPLWEQWYQAVAHVPLQHLADDDIGRALDACLHLPVLLPLALQRLQRHREAYLADAELACARLLRAVAVAGRRARARAPQLSATVAPELDAWGLLLRDSAASKSEWEQIVYEWTRTDPQEARFGWRESALEPPAVELADPVSASKTIVSPHQQPAT